ncbi:polysaccharide deacetylase family protein [Actinoallomurus spadix]|uniref:Polysaccharide deacetylase family protein n=1 Tax=Actinoallomurus spadix TaxID=79912 RepID=A0ABP3FQF7_9ACTN|nr:polysaccharide deacetylase family protein [Actinoallomurus spadix]MCO5985309.1 polysaccharide deacetylase family protein [Actinoallomurus spadix]
MSLSRRAVLAAAVTTALAGCTRSATGAAGGPATPGTAGNPTTPGSPGSTPKGGAPRPVGRTTGATPPAVTRAQIVARYRHAKPRHWSLETPGIVRALPTTERVIALTFDACGGPGGDGYDRRLIDFLRRREVPATLFLNSRWIDANRAVFRELAREPLFEIANHGTRHRPLSVNGRSAYGIAGTRDAGEVYDEVAGNRAKLTRSLGAPPRFFRPGTAYSDEIAVRIAADLGERVVGFTVNGDGGATLGPGEVRRTVAKARPGSIVICHMNHPEGGTAEGIIGAVPHLLASGHRFVRLSDQVH